MLWVVVPAFNEAENLEVVIPKVVESATSIDAGARVLVVDDGSTDDTTGVMEKVAAEYAGISVECMGRNQGKAAALRRGFGIAVEGGATIVAMMDADGQDDPTELPRLVAQLEQGPGLVTGARTVRNDRFVKRTTSKLYNRVTGTLSGTPGRDFNSGFKVMRAQVATDVAPMMYGELHRYLTVIAHWRGYRVDELSVLHHPRLAGRSKYGIARFWRGFLDLLTIRFLMTYESRPSHLFSGMGLTSLALGTLTLLYLVYDKLMLGHPIGGRPLLVAGVLMVLVGLQVFIFGLLAELVIYLHNRSMVRETR
nr:glycosyltransferase family 2 protein [Mycobacterium decipiens]